MTDTDQRVAKTLISQIHPIALWGSGFKGYGVIERGADLLFQLARPYGKRRIRIVLNYGDLYDVTVYRYGKALKEIPVAEYRDVFFTELTETVIDGIDKSCDPTNTFKEEPHL